MTDTELSALEALAKAATPGPWEHLPHNNKDAWIVTKYQNPESEEYICSIAIAFGDIQEKRNKDAAYITAANPAAVLELIQELRQARAIAEASYGMVKDAVDRVTAKEATRND